MTLATYGNLTTAVLKLIVNVIELKILERETVRYMRMKLFVFQICCIVTSVMFFGAVYTQIHDWSYMEGTYSWFITISTIGFGDFSPTNNKSGLGYQILYFLVVLCNLSLVASVIEVVSDRYTEPKPASQSMFRKVFRVFGFYPNPKEIEESNLYRVRQDFHVSATYGPPRGYSTPSDYEAPEYRNPNVLNNPKIYRNNPIDYRVVHDNREPSDYDYENPNDYNRNDYIDSNSNSRPYHYGNPNPIKCNTPYGYHNPGRHQRSHSNYSRQDSNYSRQDNRSNHGSNHYASNNDFRSSTGYEIPRTTRSTNSLAKTMSMVSDDFLSPKHSGFV